MNKELTENIVYLLNFALDVLSDNELETTRSKDNWVIGRDIEACLADIEKEIKNENE